MNLNIATSYNYFFNYIQAKQDQVHVHYTNPSATLWKKNYLGISKVA